MKKNSLSKSSALLNNIAQISITGSKKMTSIWGCTLLWNEPDIPDDIMKAIALEKADH